jgi:ketosteroid isomerase-like protein
MISTENAVDQPAKSKSPESPSATKAAVPSDLAVDEFFTQLQTDMRRPDLSQEAISAAFQAIQKLALDAGTEEVAQSGVRGKTPAANSCPACHAANAAESRFCSACGAVLQQADTDPENSAGPGSRLAGDHHYHHHYHHHYFQASSGAGPAPVTDFRPAVNAVIPRDAAKARVPVGSATLSRSEAAVRRMTQDWAQACNTKQLDDLVEFYSTDALVLRPNLSPIRGTAAIREFYFAALDAGLGDAEFEALRVELFGDIAFEAGRCKTLVPVAVGKRREERGKYLIIFARQPAGDWKALVDCWSSDLSLGTEPGVKPGVPVGNTTLARPPRKI